MASDLALAADPGVIERSADPAGFVVQACERAKAWLQEALEHGGIEQIAEIKSQAEAVRVYTAQRQLGRDAQLAAAEIVRRAERGIGLAFRRGQQNGEIARRGDCDSRGAPGVHGGNPAGFFRHGEERADAYTMTDGVSDTDFEDALREARAEGNLSRANVVRKIRQRDGDPPASDRRVPDPADRSAEAAAHNRELIGEFAGSGMASRQISERLGIGDERVRQVAREHGIDIRADAVLGRTRRHDSNRIVRQTVHALGALTMAVEPADPAGLDPAAVTEWAASMTRSIRLLSKFVCQVKETLQ
jgi:hypothetical protein